ncbi:hypothetical protein PGT21_029218 [Puccinia graminis f. sp. tritici]|uniref:Uncharacterized protein n=1 Tax=Puccinia graminis f. sp. tritici TaxID=56615 RepID=A0A5B0MG55_PUCGR|nr:hypothetical protein PGT21_029218 [Puccinia graminis f. sp. tritici]
MVPTKSNFVLWNHRQKEHSVRGTNNKIGLTKHLQSRSRGFHGSAVICRFHNPTWLE